MKTLNKTVSVAVGAAAAAGVLLGSLEAAQAAALFGPRNNLQGIDGLQIGDTIYDVRFNSGSFNSIFKLPGDSGSQTVPTFFGNQTGANSAVNAINAFFNSAAINFGDLSGDGILGNVSTQYIIPFAAQASNNGFVDSALGIYQGTSWTLGSVFTAQRNASQTPSYVEFINSRPVPTPALLPGLIGLGWTALRKRKKTDELAENAN